MPDAETLRRLDAIEAKMMIVAEQVTKLRIDAAVVKAKIAIYAALGASIPTGGSLLALWQMGVLTGG
jgi:hypothetical protein